MSTSSTTTSSTTTRSTTRRRTPLVVTLALTTALGLAACGGGGYGDDTTGSPNDPAGAAATEPDVLDPCAILPSAEIDRLLGTPATVRGEAISQFRGRTCTWDFAEAPGGVLDTGTLAIDAFSGTEFFVPGTIGAPLDGVGEEAQEDLEHGTVLLRQGEDVVQVHVLSPTRRDRTLPLATAVAGALR